MTPADNLHELVLWRKAKRFIGHIKFSRFRSLKSLFVEPTGRFVVDLNIFRCAIRTHQFQRRPAIANEIATGAQRITASVLFDERNKPQRGEQAASCRIFFRLTETQAAQCGEAQHEAVLCIVAGDAKRLDRRGDVAVIDFGRTNLLRITAGAFLCRAPTIFTLENFDFSQHTQGINPTAGAASRSARIDLTSTLIHQFIHRHIDTHDFGDKAACELGAESAALAGRMPGAEQKRGG